MGKKAKKLKKFIKELGKVNVGLAEDLQEEKRKLGIANNTICEQINASVLMEKELQNAERELHEKDVIIQVQKDLVADAMGAS